MEPSQALKVPIVVYHVAAMGNWHEVIREQFFRLRCCGLAQALAALGDCVRITHVGLHREVIEHEAALQDVPIAIVKSDPNTDHYETFAILEIERLAKVEKTERPILYFHTKGVSNPGDGNKVWWRRAMEYYVLDKWRENVSILRDRDAVGFNYWDFGDEHFTGTFWMAQANWIRQLVDFVAFHHSRGLERYSCELWIGKPADPGKRCRAHSHAVMNQWVVDGAYPWRTVLPANSPYPRITFFSAATARYVDDLARLVRSFALAGNDFELRTAVFEPAFGSPWRGCFKFPIQLNMMEGVRSDYALWIDADCEFLCRLLPEDLIDPRKKFAAVRHFIYDDPRDTIPSRLHGHFSAPVQRIYWQSCLWGGRTEEVVAMLERMAWLDADERGYDEDGINLELNGMPHEVHTLPCRYAAPSNFGAWSEQHQRSYHERSGGVPRIFHHNRETYK